MGWRRAMMWAAVLVDLHFHGVDLVVLGDDVVGQVELAVDQGFDGVDDLFLHQAAHLQHARAHGFQLGIELLGNVFMLHGVSPSCSSVRSSIRADYDSFVAAGNYAVRVLTPSPVPSSSTSAGAPGEQAIGDHADDLVDRGFQLHRVR